MKPFQGFLIEKNGTAKELKYHEIESVDKDNKILWLHFDYTSKEAKDWIRNSSNIDSVAVEALLTDETRPRTIVLNDALLIALRGVNLEPNSKPEKMISIRIFISSNVIISTSRKNILSVIEISENLKKGKGVKSSSEFLVELTYRMIDRMDSVIDKIEDRADFLEENIIESEHNLLHYPFYQSFYKLVQPKIQKSFLHLFLFLNFHLFLLQIEYFFYLLK